MDELKDDTNAPLEIERRFLIANLPGLEVLPMTHIRQGYLGLSDGYGVRVRQKGDRYFRTAKRPWQSSNRDRDRNLRGRVQP